MKELIGKTRKSEPHLPGKLLIKEQEVSGKVGIANKFNTFLTNIGAELAKNIPNASRPFESYIKKVDTTMPTDSLTINEVKEAFFSLKINKSPWCDEISFNVIKNCFSELNIPLKYLFDMSLESGIFPDKLKIARVIPLYKAGDPANISNYRPISVLPCFSKMLERIMYNRLHKYLTTEKILYPKQFGFQRGHSTEHAIVKLANQIYESFERNKYTLGVFIDLSKAFDTVNHSVLIKKLQMYGVRGVNLAWFCSYLANRKQYISLGHDRKTGTQNILCGVPQGSILGPLLFLLYVNDLPNSSVLEPIMFADDTNLFFEHTHLRILFSMVNNELKKIYEWFNANKLSLNVGKTKYSLFHKPSKTDDLPLLLSKVLINDKEIERVGSIKFLGVLLDEHLSWEEHIRYTEKKIAKNIGLLYRAKPFLGKHSLLTLYYSYIHTYLNYANLT